MMDGKTNSGSLSNGPTRRQAIFGVAMAFGGLSLASSEAGAQGKEELSHTAESIHQEVVFKASRKRVYQALMDSKQFEQIVQLSDASKTMMPPGAPPAKISPEVGGAFKTFGGLIEGRHIELVPDTRIVQAWRPAYWGPGVYSLVKFEFSDSGAGTKIVLDHRGFPDGDGKTLLDGWSKNYWQPMAKFLV
jgi:uncharacterized protein YndB with AHSA1/START domain